MDVKNEGLLPLFAEVKELLEPYATRLTARRDERGYFDLWTGRDIVIDGRRKDVYFCGFVIQKSYVGFYFMPLSRRRPLRSVRPRVGGDAQGQVALSPPSRDAQAEEQIAAALTTGWRLYEDPGGV